MNDWIKDNLLAVAGGLLLVCGFLLTQYVNREIASQLEEAGIVPEHKVVQLEKDVEENTDDISDFETRWNNLIDALAASRVNED